MSNRKIKTLEELGTIVEGLKSQGKTVSHSHGVFDLVHLGHIRHFEQAKKLADVLIVTLTKDAFVNKGPHRPAFAQEARAETIASLEVVDYVALNDGPLAVKAISTIKPSFYVKGSEYRAIEKDITGGIAIEIEAVRAVGGEIRFTDEITFSSSTLINRFMSVFEPDVDAYLEDFRHRYSADEVLGWLANFRPVRPLVVGEAIIDEYIFGDVVGKSTKDPILAVLSRHTSAYAGGSLAVANHLAGFCNEVQLVTQLGDTDRREDFVAGSLKNNIDASFLTRHNSPTIVKRRIVEQYSGNKLIEIYEMNDRPSSEVETAALCSSLGSILSQSDLTLVVDYGHGLFSQPSINLLSEQAPFLTLNAQANAGNKGINPVTKYQRADYICVAVHEMLIMSGQRNIDMRAAILDLTSRIDCPNITVTLGKNGTIHYDPSAGFFEAPALATRVADRVGAGDAVLAVTTLLKKLGAPWDIVAFVGNVAGAELVSELGNRRSLDSVALSKHIISILK